MGRVGIGVAALVVLAAAGRADPPGTVSANGTAEVKRPAEALRVQVELVAKGKDLPEALARLKDRREAARKQLAALGAAADAVEIGEPVLGGDKSAQQQQMERMMNRLREGRP